MLVLHLFLLVQASYFLSVEANVCKCGRRETGNTRILGGTASEVGSQPWYAALVHRSYGLFCGGTIINSEYVLTAGHCIINKVRSAEVSQYLIAMNLYDKKTIKDNVGVKLSAVKKFIVHPKFTKQHYNDIALIQLKEPLQFDYKNLLPACLSTAKLRTFFDKTATVIGFGNVGGNKLSQVMLQADVKILNFQICRSYFKVKSGVHIPEQFCATNPGKDACQGDSGGPLLMKDNQGITSLIGLVNMGLSCNQPRRMPGVYNNVNHYITWIKENSKTASGC